MRTRGVELGKTKEGKTIYMSPRTRSTHMHIIGSTGEGKSKFMEHLIREDIIANNGLCLIDPHGYLYNDLIRWCETKQMLDRHNPKKIILLNPSEDGWAFGFNPLRIDGAEISYFVDAMVKAVAKVWGGEDTDQTPRLERCLSILFHVLAEKNLSLLEAQFLINAADKTMRKYLTQDVRDGGVRAEWEYLNSLPPKQFREEIESTINRLMRFLKPPAIRNVVGQIESTLDFRKIMDGGYMLLVHLGTADRLSEQNARLLGTLIVNDLFMKAKGRPKGSRPFYLYIDECALFVNEDISRILTEGRKFGLHLILAHQHLAQLKKAGEDVYHAIKAVKTKVIFGGLPTDDARILAEQVFIGELDLEQAKESLSKPVVVGYIKTWLEQHSHGRSSTRSDSWGSGSGESLSRGESASEAVTPTQQFLAEDQVVMTTGTSRSQVASWSESKGGSSAETESESWGKGEALMPVLEERPAQVFSLEEQIYKAMALMVNQPQQYAIVKLPKKHSEMIKTPDVKDGYASDERVEKFKERTFQLADFAHPVDQIKVAIRERHLLIEAQAKASLGQAKAALSEPQSFRDDSWEEAPATQTHPPKRT